MRWVKCDIGGVSSVPNEKFTVLIHVGNNTTVEKIRNQIGDKLPTLRTKYIFVYEKDDEGDNLELTDEAIKRWAVPEYGTKLYAAYVKD